MDVAIRKLRALPWGEVATFVLPLEGGDLYVERVLRHLPGRRIAVQGSWKNQQVFAKIFLTNDLRLITQELDCIRSLLKSAIPTPALLFEGRGVEGAVMVCEWCAGISAEEALRRHGEGLMPMLISAVFSLYDAQLYQHDLHLNNFIFYGNQFLVIDAGGISPLPVGGAADRAIINNIALFCAQTSLDLSAAMERQVRIHMQAAGLSDLLLARFIRRQRNERIRRAMKKWRRESSAIGVCEENGESWLWQRALSADEHQALMQYLVDPHRLPLIKQGSRISVYGNEQWIIKHYRESGFLAKLKHMFFRGRADISWIVGWTWVLLGVPTPQPLMLRRCKNGASMIACGRIAGEPLSHLMEQESPRAETAFRQTADWLKRLHAVGFWHGDTKAQNILCDANRVWFIDLDAAGWSGKARRGRAKANKDILRFERNREQFLSS